MRERRKEGKKGEGRRKDGRVGGSSFLPRCSLTQFVPSFVRSFVCRSLPFPSLLLPPPSLGLSLSLLHLWAWQSAINHSPHNCCRRRHHRHRRRRCLLCSAPLSLASPLSGSADSIRTASARQSLFVEAKGRRRRRKGREGEIGTAAMAAAAAAREGEAT